MWKRGQSTACQKHLPPQAHMATISMKQGLGHARCGHSAWQCVCMYPGILMRAETLSPLESSEAPWEEPRDP